MIPKKELCKTCTIENGCGYIYETKDCRKTFHFVKKIGIDIHHVIDADPQFFSILTQDLIFMGWEVHILTGPPKEKALKELSLWNIRFTHLFSIADYHVTNGTQINYDENGNPWMDKEIWDRTKGDYCARESILLHIDDTERYQKYFKTHFCLFRGKG